MPIWCDGEIRRVDKDGFHRLDYVVMRLAFDIHNEFGRFYDERIYQEELRLRCTAAGLEVLKEVPLCVAHDAFSTTLFMDVVIDSCAVYELKTAERLHGQHRRQALNYLLLAGLHHGKLINFRPPSVEHEFVSTSLTEQARRQFQICDAEWHSRTGDEVWLRETMVDLLNDWGAFVDTDLFLEAILCLRGGRDAVMRPVEVRGTDDRLLGRQELPMLNPQTALRLTALRRDVAAYGKHLRRFLAHTALTTLQWINLNGHQIEFRTLTRQ